ncbi:MAG: HlyD family type I secretion periplasmic adaptor subunit [Gammaproteobacteria bacterium]|nr:HlyD family type I secretion periplasmic adaptor subunit [Gammaproteobacteria bacterium]MBI5618428.1 HlyD family type I secretion periplasmic adaptor subunit [Gammaproteobacteria bacterium]
MFVVCGSAWLWADHKAIDEVTRGQGKIIPSSREQVVQSLEGGVLSELLVHEGDHVEAGQVLLRIDDTRSGASLEEGRVKAETLRGAIARLNAEANGSEPRFDADLAPETVETERKLFASRMTALNEQTGALGRNLQLAEQELTMTEPLVKQGAVSEVEVLRLRRQVIELRGTIQDKRNAFRAEARGELAAKEAELAGLKQVITARADQVKRTIVTAPMRGTVKNVRVTTVGGVIRPGEEIMQIVPLEDQLLVEARIRPSDVAFLHPGQPATVKITAYDYSIYGGLQGTLELISADTIADEKNPQETYYRIFVRTAESDLQGKDGPLPIIPGMVASVEVLTGKKTVLEYILKPVLKVRHNALRER